jgi:hypothetical protein
MTVCCRLAPQAAAARRRVQIYDGNYEVAARGLIRPVWQVLPTR